MVAEIIATVSLIATAIDKNPDLAKRLAHGLISLITDREEYIPSNDALIAVASGIARMRAEAVQEALRRARSEADTPKVTFVSAPTILSLRAERECLHSNEIPIACPCGDGCPCKDINCSG